MESNIEQNALEGVDPSGVYNGPELMEAEEMFFEAAVQQSLQEAQPQQQAATPPQQQQPQPPQPTVPDIMRLTQQQILAQVQGAGGGGTNTIPQDQGAPPNITVNHTYNIHYQSDRPSPDNARDIQTYGRELASNINARSLEISEVDTSMPTDIQHEPTWQVEPRLEEVRYFQGATGLDFETEYIPDAKYKKHRRRDLKGQAVQLKDLHAPIEDGRDRECRHVGLVGNAGCGKTVLLKRYARMVLNRQVPHLQDIEVVHYLNIKELWDEDEREGITVPDMLVERFIHMETDNAHKHGFMWLRQNASKVLFIFDNADKIVTKFKVQVERISYNTKTSLRVVLENMMTDHLFRGCKTLVSARDYAWKGLNGDSRPQKFVCVGSLTDDIKFGLTRSIIDGEEGDRICHDLARFYPGALAFASDAMYLYFAISGLQWGNDHDQSKITTDIMLIMSMFQHLLRSWNTNEKIIERLPKLRLLCYNLICENKIRFGLKELRSYPELELCFFHDVCVVCPFHNHHIYYRLMEIDYCYFFQHQIMQEGLAACHIGLMKMQEFKNWLSDKAHTPHWAVIRRFVCGIILNPQTQRNLMYYMEHPKWKDDMAKELKDSLRDQTRMMDKLKPFDRLELLASLYESGEPVANIVRDHVKNICLGDVVLHPSDLYIISKLKEYLTDLHNVDLCLGKLINIEEFEELIKTLVFKARCIRLDVARLQVDEEHVKIVKEAFTRCIEGPTQSRDKTSRFPQTIFVLNTTIPEEIAKSLRKVIQTASKDPVIRVERVDVPAEEVASVHRQRSRSSRRRRHCDVM